jgi:NitT/TauT family transport system ATP-binding protein
VTADLTKDPALEAPEVPADAGPEAPAAVAVRGVGKVFNAGRRNEVTALTDIDLTVAPGELVSLIGPSGCGKSTLLRVVADLTDATTGTVVVNGKPAHRARLDNDYGMAFQQAGLFEWRTVLRNVELPLELQKVDKAERRARAREMLDLVKLGDFVDHHPWELSGGMQQRVAIARALVTRPGLLLMDEPFGALDEMTREHMQAELQRIRAELGTTVVFVTHSIPEAVYLADRVVVMSPRPGRITEVIPVALGATRSDETRADPAFFAGVTEVREALRGIERAAREAGRDPDVELDGPARAQGDGW